VFLANRTKGILLVLGGAVLWGAAGSFTKVLKQGGLTIYDVLAWRYLIGLVSLGAISAIRGRRPELEVKESRWGPAVILGLGIFGVNAAFTLSNFYTTVANAVALSFTAPLFTAALAWIVLGERVSRMHQAALAIGILGVAAIAWSGEQSTNLSPNIPLGNGLALLSGMLFGWYFVAVRRFALVDRDVFGGTIRQFLVVTLLLSPLLPSLLREGASGGVWLALLGYGVLCTGFPILMLNLAGRFLPANQSSILALSEVPFSILIGMATVQEYPSAAAWAGILAILVAGGLVMLLRR
jgi:drug/metabolite transporter (DMT)-like permease